MTTTPAPVRAPETLPSRDKAVIATLLVAAFVMILNETIMGVALPRLMVGLSIAASTAQWLTGAFLLTMAVVIPTTGFLLQRLTTRTVFLTSMTLFCAGTLLAAVAPGFWVLLGARVVQACGTAVMLPLLMTTILTLVPLHRRGSVMGNVSIVISVAPAIGPTLSGLILQYLTWRFMFVLVLPVALAALLYGAKRLTNVGEAGNGTQLVLAVGSLVLGVVCLALFGWRQVLLQSGGFPLLDLRVFRFPMFRVGVGLLTITMMGLFGVIILLPIYLQTIHGLNTLVTGLILLPGGLLMGLLAPTVGRIFDRYGPRGLTMLGAALVSLMLWQFSRVDSHTSVWVLVAVHVVLSLGLACLFTPGFTTALNPLPPHLYSHGSATLTTLQQVAGAAGTALLVTVLTARSMTEARLGAGAAEATAAGLHTAFLVSAAIGVLGVLLAAFMRAPTDAERDAAPAGPAGH